MSHNYSKVAAGVHIFQEKHHTHLVLLFNLMSVYVFQADLDKELMVPDTPTLPHR